MSLTWSQTPETDILVMWLIYADVLSMADCMDNGMVENFMSHQQKPDCIPFIQKCVNIKLKCFVIIGLISFELLENEPPHDKTNVMTCAPSED